MKTVIDKMADYVSRNGSAFEKLMRERERNNPKLQFIFEVPNPLSSRPPHRVWLMLSTSSDLLWWPPCASPGVDTGARVQPVLRVEAGLPARPR